MSSSYGDFGPLTAEIGWRVWGTPANFNGFRVLASLLHRRRSTEVTKLCTMFGRLIGWYIIYLRGSMPPNGILPGAKFTMRPSLPFSYIGSAILHGTRAAGVCQTLRRGTRNGITELSQTAPPIWQVGYHVGHRLTIIVFDKVLDTDHRMI